ncbi:sigma-70 family RNA polymerase sigma factor [Ectobacillus panaciterrae]|uniref:sigma-70 family RNA polymerase sigma factor n=1 Tax=Ectobacillus panaciterrae TaxID=363872 RepID=UPI00040742E7|nr:sigma-70 family RNA polymerase sigma factor [Ectobacillus panaciterrae]
MVLTLEQLTIEQEQMSFTERKRQGLLERNPEKAEYILKVEKMWETFALAFDREDREQRLEKLLIEFGFTIQTKAEALANRWNNKKIPVADFEHEFWITAWLLCEENYNHYTEFYLYETLLLALERKSVDVVRKYTNVKRQAVNTDSLPLLTEADNLYPSDEDIEKQATDRILVQQLLSDETLTAQERGILETMYEHSDSSYRKIGEELGLHHEQVKRNLERIRRKLRHYEYIFD